MSVSFPPSALVFDLDGTLVDSLPDMLAAMNRLLTDLGRTPATAEEFSGWVGDGARVLVERALRATGGLPDDGTASALPRYLAHYRGKAAIHTRPFPGVVATLAELCEAGHLLAVCTNKPKDLADEVLRGLGLESFFAAVLGGDSLDVRKPDPLHLTETLLAMQAGDRPALMVGDSANDVGAARRAGLPVVAVSFGYGGIDAAALGADAVIDDFRALPLAAARLLGGLSEDGDTEDEF